MGRPGKATEAVNVTSRLFGLNRGSQLLQLIDRALESFLLQDQIPNDTAVIHGWCRVSACRHFLE